MMQLSECLVCIKKKYHLLVSLVVGLRIKPYIFTYVFTHKAYTSSIICTCVCWWQFWMVWTRPVVQGNVFTIIPKIIWYGILGTKCQYLLQVLIKIVFIYISNGLLRHRKKIGYLNLNIRSQMPSQYLEIFSLQEVHFLIWRFCQCST